MAGLDWLVARPIAHRGLHDADKGIVENTASAFAAAIEHGFAIECDIQLSADGEAVIFHDATLERLTSGSGRVADLSVAALKAIPFTAGSDRIQTLPEMLEQVAGRVTLVIEIKSSWNGDMRLADRAIEILSRYQGPFAVKSFDPSIVRRLRERAPGITRGIVADRTEDLSHWGFLPASRRRSLRHLLHFPQTRPDFVSYHVKALPAAAPLLAKWVLGRPLMSWTVRTPKDLATARRWADQIVFEGFVPQS